MLHNPKLLQCDEGGHFTEEYPQSPDTLDFRLFLLNQFPCLII